MIGKNPLNSSVLLSTVTILDGTLSTDQKKSLESFFIDDSKLEEIDLEYVLIYCQTQKVHFEHINILIKLRGT